MPSKLNRCRCLWHGPTAIAERRLLGRRCVPQRMRRTSKLVHFGVLGLLCGPSQIGKPIIRQTKTYVFTMSNNAKTPRLITLASTASILH